MIKIFNVRKKETSNGMVCICYFLTARFENYIFASDIGEKHLILYLGSTYSTLFVPKNLSSFCG